jgi:hypothetical protein
MPLTVNEARSSFHVEGDDWSPVRDVWWQSATETRRREYWAYLGSRLRAAKDSELRRGLDATGERLARIRYKRPDGSTGPPLTPHRADSRFRRYCRVVPTASGATLFWGQGWAVVVGGHRSGRACGVVRDVVGLSPASQRRVKAEARAWWRERYKPVPVVARLDVPRPAVVAGQVEAVEAQLGFRFARPEGRKLVVVDAAKLDRALAEDPGIYVGSGGSGAAIAGRYERARAFLARARTEGIAVEAPEVALDSHGAPHLGDGRHRWAALRDEGHTLLVVEVSERRAATLARRFGPARSAAPPRVEYVPPGRPVSAFSPRVRVFTGATTPLSRRMRARR